MENKKQQHLWNKNKKGLQVAWNKNLTKETDSRVKKISEKLKQNYVTNPDIKCGFKEGYTPWIAGKNKFNNEIVRKVSEQKKGKNWEEMYGIEKAKQMREDLLKRQLGKKRPEHSQKIKIIMEKAYSDGKVSYFKEHPKTKTICISNKDIKLIKKLYSKGMSSYEIADIFNCNFGTILARLKENGVERRRSLFGVKERIMSEDNHLLKSSKELFIDNWLFYNKIIHIPEKKIGNTKMKTDFYILDGDTYVEYFGLTKNKKYYERTVKKLEIYKNLGLNLIAIYPNDNIIEKLKPLLKYSKKQKNISENGEIILEIPDKVINFGEQK